MPSRGSDWNTVRGTSPVPGGISTNIKSTLSQTTSVQNCFTAPATIGPRQMTGWVASSKRRLIDITLMPFFVRTGRMFFSSIASALAVRPKALGTLGPVISASRIAVESPFLFARTARREVTIDLPTPPFPLTTPMTFFTLLKGFCGSRKSCLRDEQFELQVLQS